MTASDVRRLVDDCVRYWTETGVPKKAVEEMRLELEQHLSAAEADGRDATVVVGPRLDEFAEMWASEHRRARATAPSWDEVMSGETARQRRRRREFLAYGFGVVALVAAVAVAGKGADVENEMWRWLWTGLAVVMAIGEIFTAGFFLLPFAVGAASAAILAWLGTGLLAQWLVFFGVSAVALAYLRRYIDRQDEGDQPRIGANRWVGAEGVVLEEIDPHTASGMVRVGTEEWRAASGHGGIIPAGSRIVVRGVSGSRLVVEQIES